MNRSRTVLIFVVVCALLAAAALGAAGVFGALSVRSVGFVAIAAAMVNIGIISSPQGRTGQRVAGIVGIVILLASVVTASWTWWKVDVEWWLPALLLVGAGLMIPSVALSLWSATRSPDDGELSEEAEDAPTPVQLSVGNPSEILAVENAEHQTGKPGRVLTANDTPVAGDADSESVKHSEPPSVEDPPRKGRRALIDPVADSGEVLRPKPRRGI